VTPPSHAVIEGHKDVCQLLLSNIDRNTNMDEYVAVAEDRGHHEIVRYLRDHQNGPITKPQMRV